MPCQFHSAKTSDIQEIQRLLKSVDLPYTDIESHIDHFLCVEDENKLIGVVGLEVYEDIALLRSLAVDEKYRKRGLGKILIDEILHYAEDRQIKQVYLLTTAAEAFFTKFGFTLVERNDAPNVIRATHEFTSLCPESAVLMSRSMKT